MNRRNIAALAIAAVTGAGGFAAASAQASDYFADGNVTMKEAKRQIRHANLFGRDRGQMFLVKDGPAYVVDPRLDKATFAIGGCTKLARNKVRCSAALAALDKAGNAFAVRYLSLTVVASGRTGGYTALTVLNRP